MKIEFKPVGTCKMQDIVMSEVFKYKAQVYIRCEPCTEYVQVHIKDSEKGGLSHGPRLLALNPQNGKLRGIQKCEEVTRLRAKMIVCPVDDC